MNKEIIKIIKSLKGNVLGIGLDEKMSEAIEKNEFITECNLLECNVQNKGKGKKSKTIKIKKIRKYFKKKRINYIICDYESIEKYISSFVKNSIYINNTKIYFYGKINKELIKKRYSRYDTVINVNNNIVEIDTSKAKNNYFKDIIYQIIDWINKTIELIGDILMN